MTHSRTHKPRGIYTPLVLSQSEDPISVSGSLPKTQTWWFFLLRSALSWPNCSSLCLKESSHSYADRFVLFLIGDGGWLVKQKALGTTMKETNKKDGAWVALREKDLTVAHEARDSKMPVSTIG